MSLLPFTRNSNNSLNLSLTRDNNYSEEEINLFKLLYLYSNPFTSISCLCGKVSSKHKQQRELLAQKLFITIGILRIINTISWILLIYLYFKQINKQFQQVKCENNNIKYCSNDYILNSSCNKVENEFCEVNKSYITIPVIVFLSISQIMVFFMKDRASNGI